jgi:Tfp pilus assembly protein PilV
MMLRQATSQGFSMVEVLVGMLLALTFTVIAMQAIVMATSIKVHGQELSESTNWIQTDVESIKTLANQLDYSTTTSKYTLTSSRCLATTSSAGYAKNLQDQTLVGASTTILKTSVLGSRPYNMRRVTTVTDVAPYSVLKIEYGVYRSSDTTFTSPITKFYTEIIPGAAFSCR